MRNEANSRIVGHFVDAATFSRRSPGGKLNFTRLMFALDGARPFVKNCDAAAPLLMARLRREARANPLSPSAALEAEFAHDVPPIEAYLDNDDFPAAVPSHRD